MALLEIKDIHKSFGDLNVLNGINLTIWQIHQKRILPSLESILDLCFKITTCLRTKQLCRM